MAEGSSAGGDQLKKKLLGWVQSAVSKVNEVIEEEQARVAQPARPVAPPAAPERALQTGRLGRPGSDTFARASSAPFGAPPPQPGTDNLERIPAAAAPGVLSTGPLKTPEEEAAESKKRMAFIVAYMKDPAGDPAFRDKTLVYRILTEERTYQQHLIGLLKNELSALPAPAEPPDEAVEECRAEIQARIDAAKTRQGQLFVLMKKLTGVRGKTGGTGFLVPPASGELPPPPKT